MGYESRCPQAGGSQTLPQDTAFGLNADTLGGAFRAGLGDVERVAQGAADPFVEPGLQAEMEERHREHRDHDRRGDRDGGSGLHHLVALGFEKTEDGFRAREPRPGKKKRH